MLYLLVLFPLVMAAVALAAPSKRDRPWLLPAGALLQLALVGLAISQPVGSPGATAWGGWLRLDALGRVFLGFISLMFSLCMMYAPAYLALRIDRPNRVFCANLFVMLAMMTLVTLSYHLGLMWVAMEATTLVSGPLLYFNHNPRSLEATWKMLLVGSVGIALALLGSFFLAYSSIEGGHSGSTLLFEQLMQIAPRLSPPWLHAAFVLLFVGYGTKMGLAPMHTWKPDAYGEAPGLVGAVLAGGLTSTAFLAVLRVYQICRAGPEAELTRQIMIGMGLLSMVVAAAMMIRQRDIKRMLAYSSVEQMGILVLGVGVGGMATFGALLHLINNGLTKGVLFLSAGNIHRAYGSKRLDEVQGALERAPLSGALFLFGFLAITGSPPFGPFVSEFTILSAALARGHYLAGGLFLVLLATVFIGMGRTVLGVVQGPAPATPSSSRFRDSFGTGAPIVCMAALVVLLGVYVPPPLAELLHAAAALLEAPA